MRIPDIDRLFDKVDITKYPVKKLVAIPLIILLVSFAIIAYTQVTADSPVRLGMDFKGGTMVKVRTTETREDLTAKFATYPVTVIRDTGVNEKSIEFGPMSEGEKDELIAMLKEEYGSYEMKDISPLFGQESQREAVRAVLIAFTLMAIVVFVVFRTFVPSFAVVLSAFSDIVIAVACMDLIRMELSLGTVAALLMLIGYSVDSDILLTRNLLHKRGELNEKVRNAMKTGITMTLTTISAIFAMFLVSSSIHLFSSHFAPIPMLRDISLVLFFGLTMDLLNTWLLNAGILRWYIERKERRRYGKRGVKSRGKKGEKK
ncbi:MAG: protein translocase subunit SecF [Candidatus Methanospirareceae archaeon]